MVFPFYKKGTLIDLLIKAQEKRHDISGDLVKYLIKQVVECLFDLHFNLGMAHMDLKPDNIIIKDDLTLALIDFGHSQPFNEMVSENIGTP